MNFGKLKSDVRTTLNAAGVEFYADDDIADAVQEALDEFADATEYDERQATIPMLAGRGYVDLSTFLPDTFLSPRRAQNTVTNRWLNPTDTRSLDEHGYRQWEVTLGPPQDYFLRGNWWMGVWPKSPGDGPSLVRFIYTAIPAALSDDTDTPQFPREFHQGVVDMAVSDLLAQAREPKKALLYWKSAQEAVSGLQAFVDGRQRVQGMRTL